MRRKFEPSNKLSHMKQVITFLEMKGLDTLDWSINAHNRGDIKLEIRRNQVPDGTQANDPGPDDLDDMEMDGPEAGGNLWRVCKQVFGPLKYADSYGGGSKTYEGQRRLTDELTVSVEFTRVMVCEPMTEEELEQMTEEERDGIFQMALNGEITIPKCHEITHGQSDY